MSDIDAEVERGVAVGEARVLTNSVRWNEADTQSEKTQRKELSSSFHALRSPVTITCRFTKTSVIFFGHLSIGCDSARHAVVWHDNKFSMSSENFTKLLPMPFSLRSMARYNLRHVGMSFFTAPRSMQLIVLNYACIICQIFLIKLFIAYKKKKKKKLRMV